MTDASKDKDTVSRHDYDSVVRDRNRMYAERNCFEAQLRYAHQQLAAQQQQTMNVLPTDLAAIQQQLAYIAWTTHQCSAHLLSVCRAQQPSEGEGDGAV